MVAKDKLFYFDLRGRGEPTRMLYGLADVPLENDRVSFGDDEWPSRKAGLFSLQSDFSVSATQLYDHLSTP